MLQVIVQILWCYVFPNTPNFNKPISGLKITFNAKSWNRFEWGFNWVDLSSILFFKRRVSNQIQIISFKANQLHLTLIQRSFNLLLWMKFKHACSGRFSFFTHILLIFDDFSIIFSKYSPSHIKFDYIKIWKIIKS